MAKEWNREAFHKRMEEDKQMFAQWRKEDARTEFRQRSEAARMMRTGMIAFLFVITFSVIIIFASVAKMVGIHMPTPYPIVTTVDMTPCHEKQPYCLELTAKQVAYRYDKNIGM